MAQIIIDTEKDDDRVLRAAVAFCNSITGDDVQLQDMSISTGCSFDPEIVARTVENFIPILHHGTSMTMGSDEPAFDDTEAPTPEPQPGNGMSDATREQFDAETTHASQEAPAPEPPAATGEGLDADGLPWDKRIHASSKKKVADGTWRKRKKPKDTDETAWDSYISEVEAELRQAGSGEPIPAPAPAPQPEAPAPAPDAASAFGQQQQPEPIPAAEPVAPAPAPAPTGDGQSRTLAEVMQLVTGNPEKLNGDVLNGVLSNHGIASLGLVAAAEQQRPGIIATIYSELEAMVNG